MYFLKWHEEFGKFLPEHVWKSKNWVFSWVLLSKVENMWAWHLQGSYVSWEWRMTQNLKRNWLVNSNLTWVVWWILSRPLENLKNLNFNKLLLTKLHNVWAPRSTPELFSIALQIDAKFEGKLTCTFWNDMKNLANFHQRQFESLKFRTFIGSFYPK